MAKPTETKKQELGETSQVSSPVGLQSASPHAAGIREIVVKLEEQLAGQCEKDITIKDEAANDHGYCFAAATDIDKEKHAVGNFQEQVEFVEMDDDPSGSPARLSGYTRKAPRPWPKKKKNMSYSHEQRMQMGYFAAKFGMRALKNKYLGLKDSTGRDMLKQVLQMVKEGKLSLDIPIEKQNIPPKIRNGAPVVGAYILANSEPQEDVSDGTASSSSLRQRDTDEKDALLKAQPGVSPEVADYEESLSIHIPFDDKVKIGYHAAVHGSHVAVRKFEATDSLVKECRNLAIKLSRSGHLNFDIPLEDQVIPAEDPSGIIPARLTKNDQSPQAIMPAALPQLFQETQACIRVAGQVEKHAGYGEHLEPFKPQDLPFGCQRSLPGHAQSGKRDVSLGTDLTFLRWRNRRTSLGFQSDQAFAMHLMDVHDAFCIGQFCGRDTLSN